MGRTIWWTLEYAYWCLVVLWFAWRHGVHVKRFYATRDDQQQTIHVEMVKP